MADSTIKEFLVGLGFRVNEPSWARFQSTIESATLKAKIFGDALENVAKAVAGAVARVASDFGDLFYASSRLGASVESIRAFGYAVSQMGGTVAGAQSSLRSFGDWMRQTPGAEQFLKSLGVATKDAQGHAIDRGQVLLSIGEKLAQMSKQGPAGQAMASQYAGIFGIDQDTLLAIEREGTRGRYNEAIGGDKSANVGGPMAAAAKRFEQALRDTFQRISTFATGAEGKLFGFLSGPLEKFNAWLDAHKDEINDALTRIAESAGKIGEKVLAAIEKIDWDKVPGRIDNFAKSLGDLSENFARFLSDLDRTFKTITAIIGVIVGARLGAMFGPWGALIGGVAGGAIGYGLGSGDSGYAPPGAEPGGDGGDGRPWWKRAFDRLFGGGGPSDSRGSTGGPGPLNADSKVIATRLIDHLMGKYGLTRDQALGAVGRFAHESANFHEMQEGGQPAGSGGWGYAQWTGSRRRDFNRVTAGLDPSSYDANVKMLDWELDNTSWGKVIAKVKQTSSVEDAADAWTYYYEGMGLAPGVDGGPGISAVGSARAYARKYRAALAGTPSAPVSPPAIGGAGVGYNALGASPLGARSAPAGGGDKHATSNITNNITVASNDPDSAAAAVGVHIDRSAADVYRNLQGAFS